MATTNTRTANRSPVTLKIKFKSETLNQFIERYSVDISHGGIFIRTKDPLPVGTALRFEFQLKDASPLITGDGTVVWTREFDPTRSGVAPGMGVRFDRLPSESQEILEQILAYKSAKLGGDNGGSEVPAFLDVPTKVAQVGPNGQPITGASQPFGEVPTRVTPAHVLKSLQQGDDPRRTLIGIGMSQLKGTGQQSSDDKTPLPRPLPFHADLDEFPDEAFEEATKVAEMEALAKKSAEEQEHADAYGASMDDDVTMQRSKRPTAPAPEAMAAAVAATAIPDNDGPPAKFSSVAAFDRAMRSGALDEDEDDGGFAHSDQLAAAAAASPAPAQQGEYRPAPMVAPPRDDVERDGGSSLPWIIAAAIVLVVASIGGFLLLNGKDDEKDKKDQPTPAVASGQDAKQPAAAPVTPPPEPMQPVKPGLEAVVDSVPPGAMAELVGEGQSGTTPMTFRGLEKGKKYTVKVSNAGFADKEITFEAGGEAPKAVELVAKPVVLKVTSTPPGAAVFIEGLKQKGATPATIKLDSKLVAKKQLKLSVRRSGYNNNDQEVALDSLVDGGDSMTQEVAVTLVKRAGVVRPSGGGTKPSGGGTSGTSGAGGDKPPDGTAGDKPPDGTSGDGTKPPEGDKPPEGEKPPAEKPADKPAEGSGKSGATKPKEGATKAASSGDPAPEWSK